MGTQERGRETKSFLPLPLICFQPDNESFIRIVDGLEKKYKASDMVLIKQNQICPMSRCGTYPYTWIFHT